MGICCSSNIKERKKKVENGGNKLNRKLRKDGPNDFSSLISKFGGGGGGGGAVVAAQERALHQIPGRLFVNGSSSIACLHTQQGKKGTNQDAMIFWEDFCSLTDTVFCGVFDGHGPYGHMVARKVRDCLPLLLRKEWESIYKDYQNSGFQNLGAEVVLEDDCGDESTGSEGTENFPNNHLPLKMSILKAFKLMDKELKLHPTIDCFCSGSTAVTLVMKGQDLIIGNVGDSRAVLATKDKDDFLTAVQLTVDLKPNLPREAARIQKCKGRVFALQDEPEVSRVWLPNSDSPGLAMARAFGDFCLKDFGLISVPDVYHHPITPKDEFVVLASDGIWDVLSNKEVVDVVDSAPSRSTAARALVDSATRAWRLKYPTSKMDDCAAVCLFLDHLSSGDDFESPENGMSTTTTISTNAANVKDHRVAASQVSVHVRDSGGQIEAVAESAEEKRSLGECISRGEKEEWSALEGITRVNSLVSIPRFLSGEKRTGSWRKWL